MKLVKNILGTIAMLAAVGAVVWFMVSLMLNIGHNSVFQ